MNSSRLTSARSSNAHQNSAPCGCPPPKPDAIPFDPVDKNVPKLEAWLLDQYKSSAFNTCEHQALPSMTGEPLQIHFKSDTKPVAYHSPIPVPHHWKMKVKADLDRDVRLGIIKAVPPAHQHCGAQGWS